MCRQFGRIPKFPKPYSKLKRNGATMDGERYEVFFSNIGMISDEIHMTIQFTIFFEFFCLLYISFRFVSAIEKSINKQFSCWHQTKLSIAGKRKRSTTCEQCDEEI